MNYTFKTVQFRQYASNYSGTLGNPYMDVLSHFESLNSLSPGTFKRNCAEQLELFLDMRKNDMLVKLAKGEFSFSVQPDEFLSARELCQRHDLDYFETVSHLQHMEKSGILDFYTQDRIDRTFMGRFSVIESKIDSFPAFTNHHRHAFNGITTEEATDLIHNLLLNKQVLMVTARSPGVTVYEYD
ncbi:hypothetical protein D3C87_835300 [compost metagenome]